MSGVGFGCGVIRRQRSGRGRSVLRLAALFALVIAATVPATAQATFGAPVDLSDPMQPATAPQVAVAGNGTALAVWQRFDGTNQVIEARKVMPGNVLGPVLTLSVTGEDAVFPEVAADPNNNFVVVWTRSDGTNTRIQDRRVNSTGTLTAIQTLSPASRDAADPDIAIDGLGNALIAWDRFDGTKLRIQTRTRAPGGTLGAVQTISDAGRDAWVPQVALNANANGIVAWTQWDGKNERTMARTRAPDGTVSAVLPLSLANQSAEEPQVGIDGSGNALAVWDRFDGTVLRIQLRTISTSAALGTTLTISGSGQDAFSPQVAVNANGAALIDWTRFDGLNDRIQLRARTAAGNLGAVLTLSAAGQNAEEPQVGIDGSGRGVAIWERSDGTINRIEAVTRAAGGGLGAVQTLSANGGNAVSPQVAVKPSTGVATAVWRVRFAGERAKIQTATGP
jgi:hypothetical protein